MDLEAVITRQFLPGELLINAMEILRLLCVERPQT
jgi:hypothetical protein